MAKRIDDLAGPDPGSKLRIIKSIGHLVRLPEGAYDLLVAATKSEDEKVSKAAKQAAEQIRTRRQKAPEMLNVDAAIVARLNDVNP